MTLSNESRKTLVFGGSGFLGKYIVSELIEKGHSVTVYDLKHPGREFESKIKFLKGDTLDIYSVNKAVSKANIVYNLAALSNIEDCVQDPLNAIRQNIQGNAIILEACAKNKIGRFVYSSSVYAHSKSGGVYSVTKRASEDLIKSYSQDRGIKYTILQYGTLYGVGTGEENGMYRYLKQAIKDRLIKYAGDGNELREYIHVIDAARLGVKILESSYENKTAIITGNSSTKVKDLFEMIKEILGYDLEIAYNSPVPSWKKKTHYNITPYSDHKNIPCKLTSNFHVDLGKGMIQLIDHIRNEFERKPKSNFEKIDFRENSFDDEKINIGVDFDGVIHKNSKGFHDGTIYDLPVEDSLDALKILSKNFNVIVYTAKAKPDRPLVGGKTGKELVWEWLKYHKMDEFVSEVTSEKPRAVFYIDDKAIEFTAWNKVLNRVKNGVEKSGKKFKV